MRFWTSNPCRAGAPGDPKPLQGLPRPLQGLPKPPCSPREGGPAPTAVLQRFEPGALQTLPDSEPKQKLPSLGGALGSQGCPSDQAQPKRLGDPPPPPQPCELQPLLQPRQVRGLWCPCSRPGTSAPQFPSLPGLSLLQGRAARIPTLSLLPPKL